MVTNFSLTYQLLILAILLVLLGIVLLNLHTLPKITDQNPQSAIRNPQYKVAILVPARNEEANIEDCLRSLLSQTYPSYEIWLYDDVSTDATLKIATRISEQHNSKLKTMPLNEVKGQNSKLHVVAGTADPPPGWLGKANACDQLYIAMREHSDPDYLLFTDADVRHEPEALSHAIAAAQATQAGLLSIFPRQTTLTWAERLAVPTMQHWAVYGILPLPLAFSSRTSLAFAAANGQFLLFTREAYKACGGHIAVRNQVLEDVGLARAVKRSGHRAILADGGPLVQTRMYDGFKGVWQGYSKNTYAFFGNSPFFLMLGVVILLALYVVPPVLVFYALLANRLTLDVFFLPLAQYLTAATIRFLLAIRFASRPLDALLHPLAILFLAAILLNSMRWALSGKSMWKGRVSSLDDRR